MSYIARGPMDLSSRYFQNFVGKGVGVATCHLDESDRIHNYHSHLGTLKKLTAE